jgi:16S rRNA (cytosine967-C5)-methyltransferase
MAIMEFQKSGCGPDEILNSLFVDDIRECDRGLAWEITMGTIKYLRKLDHIAQAYIKAPMRSQKPEVAAALRIGLYQLTEMTNIPQFAAVDETVSIIAETKMNRDAGFVNAILREYTRAPEKAKFPDRGKEPRKYLAQFYSYPDWLVNRWFQRFGADETEKMLVAGNRRPPVFFRMLGNSGSFNEIKGHCREAGIGIEDGRFFPEYFFTFQAYDTIKSVPFKQGKIIVQDESQGLPVYLLEPPRGSEILDLCSAPGGKTVALADHVGENGRVFSVDLDRGRLESVRQNIARVGLRNVDIICEDLLEFAPGRKFEYILLDVPCSGLGTLWQNADLRWTKKEQDIMMLADMQERLLNKAAELLAVGGRLAYSTCTTDPEEIEEVIKRFLKFNNRFRIIHGINEKIAAFETEEGFYRTWPHKHGMGGGGFALLERIG